mmetsp:Transcript_17737/g.26865  ORF Transcript_17737/g.26865 Transcript_17737/m.26865 type:complete len:204 (-) Transcript_17737:2149-2760(-)
MCSSFGTSGGNTGFEPWLEHAETITSLSNFDQLIHRAGGSYSHENALDEILVGAKVEKFSNYLRSFGRRYLGDINLNVLQKTVQVKIISEFIHEIEPVADMDKRTGISKLCVLEVLLHLFGIVNIGVAAYTLRLLELSKHTGRLNVFEVYHGIFRKVDNGSKVVVKALKCLVLLEYLYKLLRSKLFVVLLGNFNANLYVGGTT